MTVPPEPTPILTARAGESGRYPIFLRDGILSAFPDLLSEYAPASAYAFISDDTVSELYTRDLREALTNRGVEATLHAFPAGERSKTREEWARISDEMLAAGHGRGSAVVAVGGGVTGDLGGFVAATYMRGIPVVQVPTSLVAMVDASVGGKTGVDVPTGKNLVGSFHPPRAVIGDVRTIGTLPRTERAQGLVEAVKHGAIRSADHFEELSRTVEPLLDAEVEPLREAIGASVRIKAEVVEEDEYESGVRRILNFGHTLGHAIEAASELAITHGTAVAIGMVWEARIGERMGVTEAGTSERLAAVLGSLGIDLDAAAGLAPDALIEFTRSDKKAAPGAVRYVLLRRVGDVDSGEGWVHPVPDDVVRAVLSS